MVRSFQRNLRPIDSRKHIIDVQAGLVAAAPTTVTIAKAVNDPALAQVTEVHPGSRVNSIFLNIQVAATGSGALANVYMMIYKNPGANILAAQIPNANAVGPSDFKKQVFHQEMVMTEKNTTAIARTLFRGVIKVPRVYQRMGYNDLIEVQLFAPGVTFEACLQAIYKDYK